VAVQISEICMDVISIPVKRVCLFF
jgi:hypothetical protein